MATSKSHQHQEDYDFFVNKETPNYWKFAFFLLRNTFQTSKIILVAILVFGFHFGAPIWNTINTTITTFSAKSKAEEIQIYQDKVALLQKFNQEISPHVMTSIKQAYKEAEDIRNSTEEHIKKLTIRAGSKESKLETLNSRYKILVNNLNNYFEPTNQIIFLAQNPSTSALVGWDIHQLNNAMAKAISIQQGKAHHSLDAYSTFLHSANQSLTLN